MQKVWLLQSLNSLQCSGFLRLMPSSGLDVEMVVPGRCHKQPILAFWKLDWIASEAFCFSQDYNKQAPVTYMSCLLIRLTQCA